MADAKKISELTQISTIDDANDGLEILDSSEADADANKQISPDQIVSGKQTIWMPAASWNPTFTNGCGGVVTTETTAGNPDIVARTFDPTTEQHGQFSIPMPNSWDLGTVTYQVYWSRIAAPTGGLDDVHWGLQAVAIPDDASFDVAFGTEVEVSLDEAKSTEDLWVSAESAAVTIDGTPADAELSIFQISRVTGSETGGLDVDAHFVGVKLFYTTNAKQDT